MAYVGVRNSCHFGAAGYYAWLAAREGLIGIAMANDIPSVTAPGARGAITGSNPLAYAVPAGKHELKMEFDYEGGKDMVESRCDAVAVGRT